MTARQSAATDRALALVASGMTPYRAAKTEGIALSTIYRARKRSLRDLEHPPDPGTPADKGD